MNTVSFPSYVAALARRVFNVVSTLSISSHYYALQDEKWQLRQHSHHLPPEPFGYSEIHPSGGQRRSLSPSRDACRTASSSSGPTVLKASTIPLPFLSRDWWSSVSSSLQRHPDPSPQYPPPPPESNNSRRRPHPAPKAPTPPDPVAPSPAHPPDVIHQLMMNPALTDPLRTPRYPIVLCHGLYGFDSRGPTNFPSLRMHYWANTLRILRGTLGAEVIVTSVPGTGSISERATRLDEQLQNKARGRGVNFLAHSMGGLDCRHLITHIQPTEYTPLSLTSISTPHRGSPFMDWCVDNIGIGKLRQHERQLLYAREKAARDEAESRSSPSPSNSSPKQAPSESSASSSLFNLTSLPSSFTTLLLSTVDSPAYANLTTTYLNEVFNPATPDDPKVKYFSVAGRAGSVNVFHPFWFTKLVVDGVEEKDRARLAAQSLASGGDLTSPTKIPLWADERQWGNDGLVTVQSAQWGQFLGTLDNVDHWEIRGARGLEFGVDLPAIPSIGLGSAPDPTSLGNRRPSSSTSSSHTETKSETWYIREWLKFTDGWVTKAKEGDKGAAEKSSPSSSGNTMSASSPGMPPAFSGSSSPSSSAPTPQTEAEKEEAQRQRHREFTRGDQVVRSSTDRLSLVVDWLVDQIPSPQTLASVGDLPSNLFSSTSPSSRSKGKQREDPFQPASTHETTQQDEAASMRSLADAMVAHAVSGSSPSSSSTHPHRSSIPLPIPPDAKPETLASEVKKMMERERKAWRKNELATKADLERFYVALSRKIYDEGL